MLGRIGTCARHSWVRGLFSHALETNDGGSQGVKRDHRKRWSHSKPAAGFGSTEDGFGTKTKVAAGFGTDPSRAPGVTASGFSASQIGSKFEPRTAAGFTSKLNTEEPLRRAKTVADRRQEQVAYWESHSNASSIEEMMLDTGAAAIDAIERPEVIGNLPDIAGMDVIEMGAGIGRMTADIAPVAKSVIAVDFMQKSTDTNAQNNSHFGNCEFLCADVTTLEFPAASADLVFSNWLLMYLTDDEVAALFQNMLRWTRPGGYMFFRESCYRRSGDKARAGVNPTLYRQPEEYEEFIKDTETLGDGKFELVKKSKVKAYVDLKANEGQIMWLYKKH